MTIRPEDLSTALGITSIAVSVVAIAISVYLWRLSERSSKELRDLNQRIHTSTKQLEEFQRRFEGQAWDLLRDIVRTSILERFDVAPPETSDEIAASGTAANTSAIADDRNGPSTGAAETDSSPSPLESQILAVVPHASSIRAGDIVEALNGRGLPREDIVICLHRLVYEVRSLVMEDPKSLFTPDSRLARAS